MSQPGQQSIAHEYNKLDSCIFCGMYKANIEAMSHDCTPERERMADDGKLDFGKPLVD